MLTDLSFLDKGQAWPPKDTDTTNRLGMYDANRKLFQGKHDQVFDNWMRLLREDHNATLEIILNWHRRLSVLFANLLLGEPPRISAGEKGSIEQAAVDRLIRDNKLLLTAYKTVIDMSRFGDGLFKIRHDKRGIIEAVSPSIWFPVVDRDNVNNILYHVLGWTYTETTKTFLGTKETKYLKVEIHEKGRITNQLYTMSDNYIDKQVDSKETLTGIDDFLIIQVSNLLTSEDVTGYDDYTDLESIIQEMEVRLGQISRILDKHADPNMYGPDIAVETDAATGESTYRGGGKYFPVMQGEEKPGYITWEGQLQAAFEELDRLIQQLYIISETCEPAFGIVKNGLAESGSAMRRLLMAPLAKVNRIRLIFDPALKQALTTAAALEVAQGTKGAAKIENVTIEWQDGVPADDTEQINVESIKYGAGLTSLEGAVGRITGYEGDKLQAELDRIKADKAANNPPVKTPSITLGGGVV